MTETFHYSKRILWEWFLLNLLMAAVMVWGVMLAFRSGDGPQTMIACVMVLFFLWQFLQGLQALRNAGRPALVVTDETVRYRHRAHFDLEEVPVAKITRVEPRKAWLRREIQMVVRDRGPILIIGNAFGKEEWKRAVAALEAVVAAVAAGSAVGEEGQVGTSGPAPAGEVPTSGTLIPTTHHYPRDPTLGVIAMCAGALAGAIALFVYPFLRDERSLPVTVGCLLAGLALLYFLLKVAPFLRTAFSKFHLSEAGIRFRDLFGKEHHVPWEEIHTLKNRPRFFQDILLLDRDGRLLVGIDYILTDLPDFLRAVYAKLSIQRPVHGKQEITAADLDWKTLRPGESGDDAARPKRFSSWGAGAEPAAGRPGEVVTPHPSDGVDPHYLESKVLRADGELRITIDPACGLFYGRRGNLVGGLAFVVFVPLTMLLMLLTVVLAGSQGHKEFPALYFAGLMTVLLTTMSTVMFLLSRRFKRPTHLTASSLGVLVDRPGWILRRRHEFQRPDLTLEVRKGLPLITGGWKLRIRDGEEIVDVAQDMRRVESEWLIREIEKVLEVASEDAPALRTPEAGSIQPR